MPKKKLTKKQVKAKLKAMNNAMYDLALDKMGHGSESFVPYSLKKAMELQNLTLGALNQALRKKY